MAGALTAQEIHALIEAEVERRSGQGLPDRPPKRIPIYDGITGEPPQTVDGKVYQIDALEWCASERLDESGNLKAGPGYVRKLSEVKPLEVEEPEPPEVKPAKPGKKRGPYGPRGSGKKAAGD